MVSPMAANPQAVQMADVDSLKRIKDEVIMWTHLFYHKPRDDVKSYLLQYQINCATRELRELRYIDYDENYEIVDSGDNSKNEQGRYRGVAPDTIGDLTITFACESPQYRKDNFIAVDASQDYKNVAEFFLERGELVKAGQP
jgi:hypothetical protein